MALGMGATMGGMAVVGGGGTRNGRGGGVEVKDVDVFGRAKIFGGFLEGVERERGRGRGRG